MGAFMFSMNSLLMTSILGLSEVMTGYIMVLLAVCDIVGSLIGGKLSDRYGRKRVLMTVMAIELIALAFGGYYVRTYWIILCECVVMFCFSMFFPIIGALITDKTQEGKREESFSLLFLCVNVGFALGQVIAGLIFYNYTEWIFWGQGIATLLMMLIMGFLIEDNYVPEQKAISENSAKNRQNLLSLILKDKPLVLFLIATIFTGYAYMQVSYMMPLQYASFFGPEIGSKWVAALWIVNSVFCIVWSPVILKLSKNKNEFKVIMWAAILFMIGMGSFALINQASLAWLILVMTPVWTAGEVILSVHNSILLGSRAEEHYRARYQSLYEFTNGAGRMIGPVTMGYFLVGRTYANGWALTGVLAAIAGIILYRAYKLDTKS